MLSHFWKGFAQGARQTPVGFFAPAVAVWRLVSFIFREMVAITDAQIARANRR